MYKVDSEVFLCSNRNQLFLNLWMILFLSLHYSLSCSCFQSQRRQLLMMSSEHQTLTSASVGDIPNQLSQKFWWSLVILANYCFQSMVSNKAHLITFSLLNSSLFQMLFYLQHIFTPSNHLFTMSYISNIQSASKDYGCGLFMHRIYEGFHKSMGVLNVWLLWYIPLSVYIRKLTYRVYTM